MSEGGVAEIPRGGAQSDRCGARQLFEHLAGAPRQVALVGRLQQAVALVDPAVQADLVARRGDGRHVFRVQEGGHAGDVEAGRDIVALHEPQDARQAGAGAVLALRQQGRGRLAVAQRQRLLVHVKRQRHRDLGAAGPDVGSQRPAGAHAVDRLPPARLGPAPGGVRPGAGCGAFDDRGLLGCVVLHGGLLCKGITACQPPGAPAAPS